jgi:hypothetical protein
MGSTTPMLAIESTIAVLPRASVVTSNICPCQLYTVVVCLSIHHGISIFMSSLALS